MIETITVKISKQAHAEAIEICESAKPKFKLYDYFDMAVKKENEARKKKAEEENILLPEDVPGLLEYVDKENEYRKNKSVVIKSN
jgi:hypothetical protein